jgi:hypothetical protein
MLLDESRGVTVQQTPADAQFSGDLCLASTATLIA